MAQDKPVAPAKPVEPPKKMEFKLLGHNYTTPDLVAKVTGAAGCGSGWWWRSRRRGTRGRRSAGHGASAAADAA